MRKLCSQCNRVQPCPVHTLSAKMAAYNRERRAQGPEFYDSSEWRMLRRAYLAEHPQCVRCGAHATDVDHVRPRPRGHRFDPDGWDSESNLQALCSRHHKAKTMAETNARYRQSA